MLLGRCISLKAPDIALSILHHRPTYGFDIPNLSSARALIRSLLSVPCSTPEAEKTPLPESMALPVSTPLTRGLLLANLFDTYALPRAEADPVARVLLLGRAIRELEEKGDVEDANKTIQLVREQSTAASDTKSKSGSSIQGAITSPERYWARGELNKVAEWGEKHGQDISWTDKLKVPEFEKPSSPEA